jgi:UPF0271 protein
VIDLSADMGEEAQDEEQIWPMIHSANVACGGHTGDTASMIHAIRRAREHGVRLGAHPSYPDRANFGRKTMSIDSNALRASLVAQIGALRDLAGSLSHVKPHGALYNDAHRDHALAEVIVAAMHEVDPDLRLVCAADSEMARAAGGRVIREAFADRRYEPDGSLVSRAIPGSLLTVEEAVAQAQLLANEQVVIARDGTRIPLTFDTLCIHADMEHAAERLREIRKALAQPR